jgi:hypothetical protein
MTLDECITYLEHVSSERKPRSRKARQILNYLQELKDVKDNGSDSEIGQKIYDEGYKDGWNTCVNRK